MLEPKHNHFVKRGPEAPVEIISCTENPFDCPFAGTSPLELGAWLGYLEAHVAMQHMKVPPVPFSDWLIDYRRKKENEMEQNSALSKKTRVAYEKEVLPGDHRADYQATAKKLVRQTVDSMHEIDESPEYEVYVVWFCKTLRNWKALLGTTMDDGMYYEVTYNGANGETYVDVYKKTENITYYNKIPDAQDEG